MIGGIVAIGFSLIVLVIPYSQLYRKYKVWFIKIDKEEVSRYDENRIYFPSEYDRINPATSKKAVK